MEEPSLGMQRNRQGSRVADRTEQRRGLPRPPPSEQGAHLAELFGEPHGAGESTRL